MDAFNERIEIMHLIGFVMLYDHYKHMLAAQPAYLKGCIEHAKTFREAIDGNAHVMHPSVSIRVYNPDVIIHEREFKTT